MNINLIHTGPYNVNTYIVNIDGPFVFIVDPASCGYCGDIDKVFSYLASNSQIPCAIVLTHGHFDHIANIPFLKEKFPCIPLLIHEKDSAYLGLNSYKQREILTDLGFDDFYNELMNLPPNDGFLKDKFSLLESALPVLDSYIHSIVNDADKELVIKSELNKWIVYNTPGHTEGSVCLYNKDKKIMIAGDTIFYHSYGRTDLCDGSEKKMIESLNYIYNNIDGDTLVYPGHGMCGFSLKDNLYL